MNTCKTDTCRLRNSAQTCDCPNGWCAAKAAEKRAAAAGVPASHPFKELMPRDGAGVRFCTRQSLSQDLNFHGITGVYRDGRFWSADMADHWTPGEVTRWEHTSGVKTVDGGQR